MAECERLRHLSFVLQHRLREMEPEAQNLRAYALSWTRHRRTKARSETQHPEQNDRQTGRDGPDTAGDDPAH